MAITSSISLEGDERKVSISGARVAGAHQRMAWAGMAPSASVISMTTSRMAGNVRVVRACGDIAGSVIAREHSTSPSCVAAAGIGRDKHGTHLRLRDDDNGNLYRAFTHRCLRDGMDRLSVVRLRFSESPFALSLARALPICCCSTTLAILPSALTTLLPRYRISILRGVLTKHNRVFAYYLVAQILRARSG